MYKIVSSKSIISHFKSSKYFKTDLGKSFLNHSKSGTKADFSKQEEFVKFYYEKTNSFLFKEGSIGNILFYSDDKLKENVTIYYNEYDFAFMHDVKIMRNKGIEKYLGAMIKKIETEFLPNIKIKEATEKERENEKQLTPDERYELAYQRVMSNRGSASYEDIKEILKRRKR